ncbi:hypothetical protein Tco_0624957 [Tanacetum coccineum]|uniref:Uncharacterized protein n=1 Tax=Tanacetum coccineum TaxID=301880 RepID=A0ABQ4WFK0_9ASTR
MEDQPLPADASPTAFSRLQLLTRSEGGIEEDLTDVYLNLLTLRSQSIEHAYFDVAVALPSSPLPPLVSPPPENIKSLKDNIRG